MNTILVLIAWAYIAKTIETANILTLLALPSKSHHVMFERIMKELALRGHDVDFVSHFPIKDPPQGYNDLSLEGSLKIFVNNLTVEDVRFSSHMGMLDFMLKICGVDVCEAAFKTDVMKNLRETKKKYDLVITETFSSDCMMGFAHLQKAPIITMTSSVNLPWGSDRIGNPDNPSYIPIYLVDYAPRMTLYQRIWNTIYLLISKFQHYFNCNEASDVIAKDFFGPDLPKLNDLVYKTSLQFVNSHFSMNQARPAVPGFVEIGGVHINDPKPLNKHFEQLLKTDSAGIIYLSMGSMVKTESFPKEKIKAMFDAFSELPYKVIWKADVKQFPEGLDFPKNIHFEKWMPQLDILCSPNVKLFVSHGGLMGSQEAIYCGVPRLGIPIFGDQELNIRQAENMGQAIRVGFNDITKERVLTAAKELLYNQKYTNSAKQSSIIFKDRPMTPLQTAIYWTEYVIRHKGAPHLKSVATELSWYQYYLVDVSLILFTVFATVLGILASICRIILDLLAKKPKKKKKQ